MASSRRALLGILAGLALLVVPGTGATRLVLAGDPCYHGFVQPSLTVASGDQVKALPCAFAPTVATIEVGGSVTFFNGPETNHLVTGAGQAWGDRDAELAPGQKVTYTFDQAGVYPYACALHRGMAGAIVVGDGGEALAAAVANRTGKAAVGSGTGVDAASSDAAVEGAAVPTGTDPRLVAALGALAGAALAGSLILVAARGRRVRGGTGAMSEPGLDGAGR